MKVAVAGCGAVGARVARQLLATSAVDQVVLTDRHQDRAVAVARSLGERASAVESLDFEFDAVVLATPAGTHVPLADRAVRAGCDVVSVSDSIDDVRLLLALDEVARRTGARVVVGAGFSPGLTCVLAAALALQFDEVHEIHVAKDGTGGPSCAHQHHRALAVSGLDWRDGAWVRRRGGSGRELMWFPDPVNARDCYRAALPEAVLLVRTMAGVRRVTARVSATRRDRLTARLPMLRPPHAEGLSGAVRVEVRGMAAGEQIVVVAGAAERPAVAAATVSASVARLLLDGHVANSGAFGLAALADPVAFLTLVVDAGLRLRSFDGQPRTDH
jgi:hypothetical protein